MAYDNDEIVSTQSMVGCGRYSDYKWVNRGMPGTRSTTVDCWQYKRPWRATTGTHSTDSINLNKGLWLVAKRSGRPRMVRSAR